MRHTFIILFLSVFGTILQAQGKSDIPLPQKRNETLDLARTLLTTKPIEDSPEFLTSANPFNPVRKTDDVSEEGRTKAKAPVPAVDASLLKNIISEVNPSGMMQLGGDPILLFGQKKLKIGDKLPIVFQGVTYELQVTSIERTSFGMRLNGEEITRPIKPSAVTKP
jgi:hypothetical protein